VVDSPKIDKLSTLLQTTSPTLKNPVSAKIAELTAILATEKAKFEVLQNSYDNSIYFCGAYYSRSLYLLEHPNKCEKYEPGFNEWRAQLYLAQKAFCNLHIEEKHAFVADSNPDTWITMSKDSRFTKSPSL
jgi:hypothetical protein